MYIDHFSLFLIIIILIGGFGTLTTMLWILGVLAFYGVMYVLAVVAIVFCFYWLIMWPLLWGFSHYCLYTIIILTIAYILIGGKEALKTLGFGFIGLLIAFSLIYGFCLLLPHTDNLNKQCLIDNKKLKISITSSILNEIEGDENEKDWMGASKQWQRIITIYPNDPEPYILQAGDLAEIDARQGRPWQYNDQLKAKIDLQKAESLGWTSNGMDTMGSIEYDYELKRGTKL